MMPLAVQPSTIAGLRPSPGQRFRKKFGLMGWKDFTSREKEVLKMLVAGCSNKEIASPLGIQ
jgi:DNA-binding NarL/FixJ family response regulator